MWSENKSLVLSKICVVMFMVLLLAAAVSAPWIANVVVSSSIAVAAAGKALLLATIYAGFIPAAALLILLFLLLRRIGAGRVFVGENTECLRHISWCCFAGAAVCLASGIYYFPWLAVGVAAAFMGLVIRVLKNVVAKAVSLQDEADLTV